MNEFLNSIKSNVKSFEAPFKHWEFYLSNIKPKELYLNKAIIELKSIINIKKVSSLYSSAPIGYKTKNNFLNLAIKAEANIKPKILLKFIKDIESQLGRVKSEIYTDRTIDIDIIFFWSRDCKF